MSQSTSTKSPPSLPLPLDQVLFFVDMGGGSFTAYLLANDGTELVKCKSSKDPSLFSPEALATFTTSTGFTLYNTTNGTFCDYSDLNPAHYASLCSIFNSAFEASLHKLLAKTKYSLQHVSKRIVKQTGKIRNKLLQDKYADLKTLYTRAMTTALGELYEYALLPSRCEAEYEGGAFFTMNGDTTGASTIGFGVGSSSTQAYSRTASGKIVCASAASLGALPSKKQMTEGKSVGAFYDQFATLLHTVVTHREQTTVIALNAIGYALEHLTKCKQFDDFRQKVVSATPVSPQEFLHVAAEFQKEHQTFQSNLLLGFALALSKFDHIKHVLLERKGSNGKPLKYESSWIKYAALHSTQS